PSRSGDPAAGHVVEDYPDPEVARRLLRPGMQSQGFEAGDLFFVGDDRGDAVTEDAPAGPGGRVPVVDLESEPAFHLGYVELRADRGADHDRPFDVAVVHREDLGLAGVDEGDPADRGGLEEPITFFGAEDLEAAMV